MPRSPRGWLSTSPGISARTRCRVVRPSRYCCVSLTRLPRLVSCAVSSDRMLSRRRVAQITGCVRRNRSIMVTSRISASTSRALATSMPPLAASSASCSAARRGRPKRSFPRTGHRDRFPAPPGPAEPAGWQAAPGYHRSSRTRRASRGRPPHPPSPGGCRSARCRARWTGWQGRRCRSPGSSRRRLSPLAAAPPSESDGPVGELGVSGMVSLRPRDRVQSAARG